MNVALMPIASLILLSEYFSYIRTKNCSLFEPSRTPYWIFIIPGLVAIASKHRYLTASYYGCIYILHYNDITQSRERPYFISFFIWTCDMSLIWYRCCLPRPAQLCSEQLLYRCFFRLVYRFWCKAPRFRLQPRRETLYHTRNTSYSLMCYW